MSTATASSINMEKGQKIDLSKEAPQMKSASLGLGWDTKEGSGADFDLDASAFMLNKNGKMISEKNLVYFNNLKSPCESVVHSGDNLTGAGAGDDETVRVQLDKVPAECEEILLVVNIYKASERKQNFGQVKNAFIRIYDTDTKQEIAKYNLSEDYSVETGVMFGRLYRHSGVFKFEASGKGEKAELQDYISKFR